MNTRSLGFTFSSVKIRVSVEPWRSASWQLAGKLTVCVTSTETVGEELFACRTTHAQLRYSVPHCAKFLSVQCGFGFKGFKDFKHYGNRSHQRPWGSPAQSQKHRR